MLSITGDAGQACDRTCDKVQCAGNTSGNNVCKDSAGDVGKDSENFLTKSWGCSL